ncbi:MAG: hypothetical protein CSYNP_02249 [Syntrophus sp. SKADARSKE-3]|nr:hypothetical protein [Syntrophus sp. SKADARSKE-3]
MSKLTVYQFRVFDINQGMNVLAKRMATLEAINTINGAPIMETAQEVDATEVDGNGHYPKSFKVIYLTKTFPIININQMGTQKAVEYFSLKAAKSAPFPTDADYISAVIFVIGGHYIRSKNSNEWTFQEN